VNSERSSNQPQPYRAVGVDPGGWRPALRGLVSLNNVPWRWSAGVQAGVAMGAPLAAFTLAGHQPLGLIAVLGAFTALYCANLLLEKRVVALPFVGAGFVVASVFGVLGSATAWLSVASLILVAVLASSLAFRVSLGPPGPMQFVLVAGISAHVAAPASLGGAALNGALIPVLVAVGAMSAYLLVVAPLILPAVRRRRGQGVRLRQAFSLASLDRETTIITARVVAAVTVAGVVSLPLGVNRAYWVIMVAGAVLQASHVRRLTVIRTVQRVLGTIVGVILFALLTWLHPSGLWLVGVLALLQFAIEVVVGRNYGLALIFITPLALTISAVTGMDDPIGLAGERIGDTLLGALIALAVLWISERMLAARRG
jgi:Fusaric acid resistance protein-like